MKIIAETQRWEKRTGGEESNEGKILCVRQKMAGYLRSYSTLTHFLSSRYYWLKQRQSGRRRAHVEGKNEME